MSVGGAEGENRTHTPLGAADSKAVPERPLASVSADFTLRIERMAECQDADRCGRSYRRPATTPSAFSHVLPLMPTLAATLPRV